MVCRMQRGRVRDHIVSEMTDTGQLRGLARAIVRIREEHRVPWHDVADVAGVDYDDVRNLAHGRGLRRPSRATIERFAAVVDAVSQLTGDERIATPARVQMIANEEAVHELTEAIKEMTRSRDQLKRHTKRIREAEEDNAP